ncbi:iron reductase [Roridomyces roridus]|uniref:Iron reductase n=1 Tax=Roridomyces roridus TaxID=1738132 RepID=A0AAD7C170_9AGAR|nr:iron reductase [Roridomyces roridus]
MSDVGKPVIPEVLLPYESYTLDPKWQIRFTAMWCAALGLFVLLAIPHAFGLRSIRESAVGWLGIRLRGLYEEVPQEEKQENAAPRVWRGNALVTMGRVLGCVRLWSLPGIPLNVGQMLIVAGYAVFALVCIVKDVPLMTSPNRAGFIALAQLPPVFLFASKNSPLTALLLGPGVDYTKLNYIHRWAGRGLFLAAAVHATIWINNHIVFDLPILTQQKEGSGVGAFGALCVLVLTSVAPIRRYCYSLFLVVHYLTFPAFFITICYHTTYAPPWIFPPLAFYAFDLLLRIFKWRVVVARIEPRDGGMSLIHIPDALQGWRAGQHVQVRAMIGARAWESHPLSVCCAPPNVSCLRAPDGGRLGMLLAARACGDWSRSLYDFASTPEEEMDVVDAAAAKAHPCEALLPGREAHLILEGPYGGPTLRSADYETVLLFAGGSGATFTLAVLDELVGLLSSSSPDPVKTRRIEWHWAVRSFGAILWFAPYLQQIASRAHQCGNANVELRIKIFVTCLCDPEAIPPIRGCVVSEAKPSVSGVLRELLDPDLVSGEESLDVREVAAVTSDQDAEKGVSAYAYVQGRDGVAVFAAGPGRLIREAGNAVVRANLLGARGRRAGGVAFCAEEFIY